MWIEDVGSEQPVPRDRNEGAETDSLLSHQSFSDDIVFHASTELCGRTNQVSNSAEWLLQPFFPAWIYEIIVFSGSKCNELRGFQP